MFDKDGMSMKVSNRPSIWVADTEEVSKEEFEKVFNLYKEQYTKIFNLI